MIRCHLEQLGRMHARQLSAMLGEQTRALLARLGLQRPALSPHPLTSEAANTVLQRLGRLFPHLNPGQATDWTTPLLSESLVRQAAKTGEELSRPPKNLAAYYAPVTAGTDGLDLEQRHTLERFYLLHHLGLAHALTGGQDLARMGVSLVEGWLTREGRTNGIAWMPLNIAERLVEWALFLQCCSPSLPAERVACWLSHMRLQAQVLLARIEYRAANNHLLFNARSLLLISYLFQDARMESAAAHLLRAELGRQFGPDGAHLESSAGYQQWTAQCLAECCLIARHLQAERVLLEKLAGKCRSAAEVLAYLTCPDGVPAPLGDCKNRDLWASADDLALAANTITSWGKAAGQELPCNPERLTAWSAAWGLLNCGSDAASPVGPAPALDPLRHISSTGYAMARSGTGPSATHLVCKTGPLSAHLPNPGHGHADVLAFNLWYRGIPLFVDAGTGTYADSLERAYFRSSAAHNTVLWDQCDQAVLWKAFRAAYLPAVSPASVKTLGADGFCIEGSYQLRVPGPLRGSRHSRLIASPDGSLFAIRDTVQPKAPCRLRNQLLIHPRWTAALDAGGAVLTASAEGYGRRRLGIFALLEQCGDFRPTEFRMGSALYSPAFGCVEQATLLYSDAVATPEAAANWLLLICELGTHGLQDGAVTWTPATTESRQERVLVHLGGATAQLFLAFSEPC